MEINERLLAFILVWMLVSKGNNHLNFQKMIFCWYMHRRMTFSCIDLLSF